MGCVSYVAFIVLWLSVSLCSQFVECITNSFSASIVSAECLSFTLLTWCVTLFVSYLTIMCNSFLCCWIWFANYYYFILFEQEFLYPYLPWNLLYQDDLEILTFLPPPSQFLITSVFEPYVVYKVQGIGLRATPPGWGFLCQCSLRKLGTEVHTGNTCAGRVRQEECPRLGGETEPQSNFWATEWDPVSHKPKGKRIL